LITNHADAEFYHAAANGDPGLHVTIAGHECTVKKNGPFITVIDHRNAKHDFLGCKWREVKATMEERLEAWEHAD
jgi:hypothetical protein